MLFLVDKQLTLHYNISMASNNTRHKHFYELITTVAVIVAVLAKFVKVVAEKDRLVEFFISTPLLIYIYYSISHYIHAEFPVYLLPITAYFLYWSILLTMPKKTHFNTEVHWADEDWWWSLNGWDFEEEVAKVFRKHGYKADVTKKTGDNGADIIMYYKKRKIIVQCKHYKAQASPEAVRALWGIRDEFKADAVIMVASSGVSKLSLKFINKRKPLYTLYTLPDIINMATNKL